MAAGQGSTKKKTGGKVRRGGGAKGAGRRKREPVFLGEVFTEIAGMQYYDADVRPGERIQLEREPENEHDENAVRVENRDFRQAGHVPRRISSWLAPLIDAGEVRVEGRVAESSEAQQAGRVFILIELYLEAKGGHILRGDVDPASEAEAMHQAVLSVWNAIDEWTDGDVVSSLANRLRPLDSADLLPGTRMLLALFKHRAWALRRRTEERAMKDVRDSLERTRIGKPLFWRNLTVFPLFAAAGGKPVYILLQEAIEKKKAEVREVSDEGSVPELFVENRTAMPILIPEGEILIGAMQDRTVNVTILVAAKAAQVIPVSCVEQGRWSRRSDTMASSWYATPGLRSRKIASSQARRRTSGKAFSDQSQVWADVAESLGAAGAVSDTGTLADAFEKAKGRTDEYREKISLPEGATGVLVASGEDILGMDLFDSSETLGMLWPRLSESYFFTAALREKTGRTRRAVAAGFMKALPKVVSFAERPAGTGRELELPSDGYAGSGIWHKGRLCHLSAFRTGTG